MSMRLRLLTLTSLALAACGTVGTGRSTTSDIPAAIAVPSANRLALTLEASGLQNYECRAKAGTAGGYDWVLVAPEAVLKDTSGAIVGRHFAGPNWEHGDGSKVTGKAIATVTAPQAGNIPWQLLQATSATAPGVLAGVTYVQRTHTEGGTAPSETCSAATAGTRKGVRYSADYLFYKS